MPRVVDAWNVGGEVFRKVEAELVGRTWLRLAFCCRLFNERP